MTRAISAKAEPGLAFEMAASQRPRALSIQGTRQAAAPPSPAKARWIKKSGATRKAIIKQVDVITRINDGAARIISRYLAEGYVVNISGKRMVPMTRHGAKMATSRIGADSAARIMNVAGHSNTATLARQRGMVQRIIVQRMRYRALAMGWEI